MEQKMNEIIKTRFPSINKNNSIEENEKQIKDGYNTNKCAIKKEVELTAKQWDQLTNNLLENNNDLFEQIGGADLLDEDLLKADISIQNDFNNAENFWNLTEESQKFYRQNCVTLVVKISHQKEFFYVNTEGHNYARYVSELQNNN